jgi:hypothetical protein
MQAKTDHHYAIMEQYEVARKWSVGRGLSANLGLRSANAFSLSCGQVEVRSIPVGLFVFFWLRFASLAR